MSVPVAKTSFGSGEFSPTLWGRTDLRKFYAGCATMRNFFVNFRGGASTRAGLAYIGICKQRPPASPPRDIDFQYNIYQSYALEFGDQYMRVKTNGAYVTETPVAITGATQANPCAISVSGQPFSDGDWVYIAGVSGMTPLNGKTFIVANSASGSFTLTDLFGNAINSTTFAAYTSGGTAARIYTLSTPYAAVDLKWLKFTQDNDVMTLCCWNQDTATEYAPYDLARIAPDSWTLTKTTFGTSISSPAGVTAASAATGTWEISYAVTAVDATTGDESEASAVASVTGAANPSVQSNTITVSWDPVENAASYNIYRADPAFSPGVVAPLALMGFIGQTVSTSFTDSNITADMTTVPPTHQNPFAAGALTGVRVTAGGTGYTQGGVAYAITTSTGSGGVLLPIVTSGAITAVLVVDGGEGYAATDTVSFSETSASGATATLLVGPETGTDPAGATYFQERRWYFSTQNAPDTYFGSQPGAFSNMDSSIPTTAADAIVGTPWAQQVNGIQWMVPMQAGIVILTGLGAWQLTGGYSSPNQAAAITPSSQDAVRQAFVGCAPYLQPLPINFDILYVQSKGSIVRDLTYNFWVAIYTGEDITILSNHLFDGHTLNAWSWCEEPFKIVWVARDDGKLLSLTYLKEQDVYGWARHDTQGQVVSVCAVTEPPVDALYVIAQRYLKQVNNGAPAWVYTAERMDNRDWQSAEDEWAVDCGLALAQNTPSAQLTASSATGSQNITSADIATGGSGYGNAILEVVDPAGTGSGAVLAAVLTNGVITSVAVSAGGSGYSDQTVINVLDADGTGSGAVIYPVITNIATFTASSGVFTGAPGYGAVGDVIRMGGGKATVTSYLSTTEVQANITQAITATIPFDPDNTPYPQPAGDWSITTPVATVAGLDHLDGMTVSILADGVVQPAQTVSGGEITLQQAASDIKVGLPFSAQLQTLYLATPGGNDETVGRRKNVSAILVRCAASRGIKIGMNQPDASAQPGGADVPWTDMVALKEYGPSTPLGSPLQPITGDAYEPFFQDWDVRGQVAVEIDDPVGANILMLVPDVEVGDDIGP